MPTPLTPHTIWITGLSASGKTTLGTQVEAGLQNSGCPVFRLDGDRLRSGLSKDLGYCLDDRRENSRRAAEVAKLMNDAGLIVIVSMISPKAQDRAAARHIINDSRLFEVHLSTPLCVCEARDPKGLYKRARAGQIPDFTGISSVYEEPASPDLRLDTSALSINHCTATLLTALQHRFALAR